MRAETAIADVEMQKMGHVLQRLCKHYKIASNAFIPV
jgi:hypothetical protein